MVINIIYLICVILVSIAAGGFAAFIIFNLSEINHKNDNIPEHHWSMGVYMNDIPQNYQNILPLSNIKLKIYEGDEYSDFPVPRIGEEVCGVYYGDHYIFDMKGIVTSVYYYTDIDWIEVSCKCTYIHKK